MAWRGSSTSIDRFWAALPYILPIASSSLYAMALVNLLPATAILMQPIALISRFYYTITGFLGPYGGLLIFFGLFIFVVRNSKISHFIRYNTMQALMIGIIVTLVELTFQFLNMSVGLLLQQGTSAPLGLLFQIFFAGLFILITACYSYSLFYVVQGKYAEIKWISDAAYAQTQV